MIPAACWEVQEEGGGRTKCSCKSSDAPSKQQASSSQRTPADWPCDKDRTRTEQRTMMVSLLPPLAVFWWTMWRMPGNWNLSLLCSTFCQIIPLIPSSIWLLRPLLHGSKSSTQPLTFLVLKVKQNFLLNGKLREHPGPGT